MARILVIDDDPNTCSLLNRILAKSGHDVTTETVPSNAVKYFRGDSFDLVITDFYMPEMNGLELLEQVKNINPDVDVMIMTAFATVDNAVDAMRKGAYDYIVKPFQNDDLLLSIKRVLEKRKLSEENKHLRAELSKKYSFHNIIGKSPSMQKIFATVRKVADSDATALLIGESGTGKELVARAIHYSGKRKDKNFVAINCSALPDTLLESELFGHTKGAFTGATESKQGLFEYANGGTLLLDEIADTSPSVQAKLLRVIEDKKIRKLGDNKETEIDVRIIAATSRNLKTMIDESTFREDLFYRINVFPISIPALRDRKEDIPLLTEHFLKGRKKLHPDALDILTNYNWPGNVRELENVIERTVVFAGDETITQDDLPAEIKNTIFNNIDCSLSYQKAKEKVIKEFNQNFISCTLRQTGGNVTKAAEKLEIDRANLQRLLRKYRIISSEYKE
ncbi:MAG: sigma-54 dependent transcriptional regulator [Nitrospirae bacterium]|nr:sigma-54 dependent transcriptional regulator [Nitrospirota bacterium]MCL5977450.1 sigma-54 dependent transcriptional regulator [Nitrospirota bacterium]